MGDTIKVQYADRTLRADLVTFVASAEAARLFASELDTDGEIVPVWKAHAFTYDDSGNLKTDTVADGTTRWVRTYAYAGGNLAADSGWVRQ